MGSLAFSGYPKHPNIELPVGKANYMNCGYLGGILTAGKMGQFYKLCLEVQGSSKFIEYY